MMARRTTTTQKQALRDCYIMARRRLHLLRHNRHPVEAVIVVELAAWGHIVRFCESSGLTPDGILRDGQEVR